MSGSNLQPISPEDTVSMYISERREDASFDTVEKIQDTMDLFLEWSDVNSLSNMNDLDGRKLTDLKSWIRDSTENNRVSLNGHMSFLRRFLVFAARIEAVDSELPEKTPVPNVPDDLEISTDKPDPEQVEGILGFLKKYKPYSRVRIEFQGVEENAWRLGAERSIDIVDLDLDEQEVHLKHRPHREEVDVKGTPLKNGKDSERIVNISSEFATAIKEYLDSPDYYDVTDQFGRQPLLTTESGRIDESTLRRDFYKVSRPCVYGDSCPHDRNSSKCKATTSKYAYKCPSSYSPHPFRRWSIETQIEKGIPKDRLSDRVDVSVKVLDKHYDQRSKERKSQERLKFLERVFEDFGDANATLQPAELSMLTDEQGDIDPELLAQFTARSDDRSKSEESEGTDDDQQLQLDDIEYQLTGPTLLFLVNFVKVNEWIFDRLAREMQAMSPRNETPFPTRRKAVKAVAGYWLFTMLLSLNLILTFPEQIASL